MSVATVLKTHHSAVFPPVHDFSSIRVRRNHLLEDTLHKFRCGMSSENQFRVTFLGEPAADEGIIIIYIPLHLLSKCNNYVLLIT